MNFTGDSFICGQASAGVSVRVGDGWRVGAETYGEITVTGDSVSWAVAGPNVSLTSGRLWGSATLGPGLFGVRDAGRITFGLALPGEAAARVVADVVVPRDVLAGLGH